MGMNTTIKRHLISASTTFLTGFAIGVLPYLNNIDLANLGKSAIFALILTGIRAGIKLLVEKLIAKYSETTTEPQG